MKNEELIARYEEWEKKLNAYRFAMTLIGIDANDRPPLNGAPLRAKHTSLLAGELFRIQNDESIPEITEELLADETLDPVLRRRLQLRQKGFRRMGNVPEDVYLAYHDALQQSERAWLKYKQTADWERYYPYLEKLVEMQKKLLTYRNDNRHPYDILLDDNEEGWNMERYDAFFEHVKKELVPLIHKINEAEEIDDAFLHQSFDTDEQRKLMKEILEYLGFTNEWGKLGESEHPLTTWISVNDVRITTKYREHDAVAGILSTVHETGHAWFTHNVDEKYDGTMIVSGISAAMHESQSRLFENYLGRTKAFWEYLYPRLAAHFPEQLGNVSVDQFVNAINVAKRSLIRTEADELTYPMHILIRYEIEKGLFDGSISTEGLDETWDAMYEKYLGIKADRASEGILQDVHWSDGSFGYFPTYALGSAFSAQFVKKMREEMDVDEALRSGHFEKCVAWLKEHIHRYGCRYDAPEIMRIATGSDFDVNNYLDYLEEKYTNLYHLK